MMTKKLRIFDTNIFSSQKNILTADDLDSSALSLVVFYELTATKILPRKRSKWEETLQLHRKGKTLVSPNIEDWHIASKVVWMMHQNNEPISVSATALQNDVLICQSALSFSDNPPIIVTSNIKDFSLIKKYLEKTRNKNAPKLIIKSAKEYFG